MHVYIIYLSYIYLPSTRIYRVAFIGIAIGTECGFYEWVNGFFFNVCFECGWGVYNICYNTLLNSDTQCCSLSIFFHLNCPICKSVYVCFSVCSQALNNTHIHVKYNVCSHALINIHGWFSFAGMGGKMNENDNINKSQTKYMSIEVVGYIVDWDRLA